jgi:CheY-like chemotaxis protein
MGGEVLVRSEAGKGTTFTVRLMLSEASHAVSDISPRRACGYKGPRLTILTADDDPSHLELIQSLLEPLGFTTLLAADGHTCLELARTHLPTLAMLDISMPDMTGWKVAAELRGMQQLRDLRIIMVSANAHEYSPGADGNSLHDAFMMKPIDIQLLIERVGHLLEVEWLYELPSARIAAVTDERVIAPSGEALHHIDDLYRLGRIGHVRGIEAKLQEIEAENPATAPFAAHLRTLVSNFDLKRYMSVLDAIRSEDQQHAP